VHFGCHGTQNLGAIAWRAGANRQRPHRRKVADIRSERGDFAFLSACKTAIGGVSNPDEAITLAAALQYGGRRHVISTLWPVGDQSASQVTAVFYERACHNSRLEPEYAGMALHHAVRRLGDSARTHPSRWAPFVHAGP
jgi:CHAT domain-containing protein